jgi:hypothetical protein
MPLKPTKRFGAYVLLTMGSHMTMRYIWVPWGGNSETSQGEKVVLRLIDQVINKGYSYQLYMDNFFSSPTLSLALREYQTFVIGTARVNRKGFPESLRDVKTFAKTTSRGEHKSVMIHNVKTECLRWKDNKPVALINSICKPSSMSTVKRTAKDGTRNTVPCPESIKLYNSYMGGVDLFDFKRKTYSCSRKSKMW